MSQKQKWTKADMPSLEGKIIIVTGGNSGLGYESVKAFAEKGAHVIMTCRNLHKGEQARKHILHHCKNAKIDVMLLNLMSLKSIRDFVNTFKTKFNRLDVLLNNAGIMKVPYRETEDGIESQQGTNHFGHFALTGLLLDTLKATQGARVVNVSSLAHKFGDMDFENLLYKEGKGYSDMKAYGRSKLENLLFTFELQRFFEQNNYQISALAAHPGVSGTNLFNHIGNKVVLKILRPLFKFFVQSPLMGALPQIRASVDINVKGGEYYGPDGRREMKGHPVKVNASELAQNTEIAAKLWKFSEEITGVKFE
jgi:NAD(P)-dependent dehydrogenase (short-subunit alcohol dehydrogenase family)